MIKRKFNFTKKKLKKFKRMYSRFKTKFRRKRLRGYRLRTLKFLMMLRGPEGNARNVGEAILLRKKKKERKRLGIRYLSTRVSVNLFKVTYDILLSYHSPLGRRTGEWKAGVMLTNIFLIKNRMSILDLTSIFFELRKMVNRFFKAVKLRKGVSLLNGRRYGWRKVFTFIFEKWLPGFFTNFQLNIKEIIGYFKKKKIFNKKTKIESAFIKNYVFG